MKYVLKNARTGEDIPEFYTTVDVKKTETHLVFDFFCKNSKFFSKDDKYNAPIYDGDVCEAFICTSGNISDYYEIEVAPNNCQFLAKIHNKGDVDGELNLDLTFVSEEENFLQSEVEIVGDDYKLKISVQLNKIGYDEKIGVKYNAYRIETEGGIVNKNLLALNPTMKPAFHVPEKFIDLVE